jgi:hypothetical protein
LLTTKFVICGVLRMLRRGISDPGQAPATTWAGEKNGDPSCCSRNEKAPGLPGSHETPATADGACP